MPFDRKLLEDVAKRGKAALEEYQQGRQMQGSTASRALDSRQRTYGAFTGQDTRRQATGRGAEYDRLVWGRSSRLPEAGSRGIGYGQLDPESDYLGFKNSSDLFNAIEGRAYGLRGEVMDEADLIRQEAEAGLERVGGEYDASMNENIQQAADYRQEQRGFDASRGAARSVQDFARMIAGGAGPGRWSSPEQRGETAPGAPGPDEDDAFWQEALGRGAEARGSRGFLGGDTLGQGRPETAGGMSQADAEADESRMVHRALQQRTDYHRQALNPWLAEQVDPLAQQLTYVDETAAIPFSEYAQAAGAEYGVDPNIVAGRWGPAEDYRDFGQQRNLTSIEDYGLPFDEVVSINKAADSDLEDQAEAGQDAELDQLRALVGSETGMDPQQLATTTNMDEMQLAQVIADPGYQQADAELAAAVEEQDVDAITETLRAVGAQRPDIYQVLLATYDAYIPSEYDFYG